MEPPSVVRGKPPSILATNGLSLMGTTANKQAGNPYDNINKQAVLKANSGARGNSANRQQQMLGGSKDLPGPASGPGATDRSFYPTPNANQPFDLSLEDFLSP